MLTETFAEDVLSVVGSSPVLLSDVLGALRGSWRSGLSLPSKRPWRGVREDAVVAVLHEFGAYTADVRFASGLATYVASAPFSEVRTARRNAKPQPVTSFRI